MKILLIHNIATSYYKNIVFNEFYKHHQNFKVIHLAETEKIRDWKIDLSDIKYPYEVLGKGSIDNYNKFYFAKKIWDKLDQEKPNVIYLGGYFHISFFVFSSHCENSFISLIVNIFNHGISDVSISILINSFLYNKDKMILLFNLCEKYYNNIS